MNKSSMHNLLKNRRYIGEYRYGETITPDGMPRIVPREIFDSVQFRMEGACLIKSRASFHQCS